MCQHKISKMKLKKRKNMLFKNCGAYSKGMVVYLEYQKKEERKNMWSNMAKKFQNLMKDTKPQFQKFREHQQNKYQKLCIKEYHIQTAEKYKEKILKEPRVRIETHL